MSVSEHGRPPLSPIQEDYLKQILLLERRGPVGTQALASRLGVRPATVTGMVQRLARLGLVQYRPYSGTRLTEGGRQVALEMVRHHRLLETYLVQELGYAWDEVHDEAERLEHVISELFEERIAAVLGDPTHDPHGDPIPSGDLVMPPAAGEIAVGRATAGASGTLVRVAAQDPDSLHLCDRLGLRPGASLTVIDSVGGSVRVDVCGERYLLPQSLADELFLRLKEERR